MLRIYPTRDGEHLFKKIKPKIRVGEWPFLASNTWGGIRPMGGFTQYINSSSFSSWVLITIRTLESRSGRIYLAGLI